MAQDITLWGASYSDVPAVDLPKTTSGTARFTDVTATTAVDSDVLQGKYFFTANGVLTLGTNAGGSGDGYVWQDAQGYVHLSDEEGTQPIYDTLNVNASGTYTPAQGHAYNSVVVPSGTATPASSITGSSATVTTGTNTLTLTKTVSNTPQVSAGYVSSGTAGNSSVSLTANVNTRSSSDLTVSGATVTAPSGYYSAQASKSIPNASWSAEGVIETGATISTTTGTLILKKDDALMQLAVSDSGYISSGLYGSYAQAQLRASCAINNSSSLTASGATVTAPSGYYASNATKTIASGTEGTPTATKGTVSNHSISVTPSVTNSAGYISGGTKTGTAVTVSASELVSGSQNIVTNGNNIDVTNLASINVAVPTGSATLTTKNITANGTYDAEDDNADGYSSVTVNVSGASNFTLLGSEEFTVNTSVTSAVKTGSIVCTRSDIWTANTMIYVKIRDKAGVRAGYFYGSDSFFFNGSIYTQDATSINTALRRTMSYTTTPNWKLWLTAGTNGYGVYGYLINNTGGVDIYERYNSNYLGATAINGTFLCEVYSISFPSGTFPF